jgi:uncharacterized membrane protein
MHAGSSIGIGHEVSGAGGMLIFFWLFVIFVFIYSLSFFANFFGADRKRESAEDILKKRYAADETPGEEFDRKKRAST